MRKLLAPCVVVLVLVLAGLVLAQQPPAPPAEDQPAAVQPPERQFGGLRFVDQMEVNVVNVDVSVRDKKGNLVLDLKPEDFELYQDGKVQQISNFALYTRPVPTPRPGFAPVAEPTATPAAEPTPVPAAEPTPVPAAEPAGTLAAPPPRDPRFLAIYVDNENLLPQNRNRVIGQVTEFIDQTLKEPDLVMVVSYQRSLKVLQPFTSDPTEVNSALRKVKRYTGGRSQTDSDRKRIEDYINDNSSNKVSVGRAYDQVESFAREQRNNLTFTVRSIQELVGMMSGLPGKKSILYLSDGLPMVPGLELYYALSDVYASPSILSRSREYESSDLFRGLVTTAAASGVALYTIDTRGLESGLGIEAENRSSRSTIAATMTQTNYQDSLVYMAERTGGIAVLNSNDVTAGLERIAEDIETYYALGYRLTPSGQDRAHRIEVQVKGHPEYELKYKPTFIEKTLSTRIGDRVISGLAFDLDDNPLGIVLNAGDPMPASGDRWTLPVEIKVPVAKVALIPDGDDLVGFLTAYYAARDEEEQQSDLQRVDHAIRVPASSYDEQKRQHIIVTAQLLLEPGRYRISVGIRDQLTNQAGYALLRRDVHPELK